jgi:hypothetical protein
MRKIALIAMLAIVGAMMPMSTAGTQPLPDTLDGVGTIMLINPSVPGIGPIDVWIEVDDGNFVKYTVSAPGQEEVQLPKGSHAFQLCFLGVSTDQTCAPTAAPLGPPGTFDISSNDILNGLLGGVFLGVGPASGLAINENDTEETETDDTKLTFFNGSPYPIQVCVDDDLTHDLPAAVFGTVALPQGVAEFDGQDGETRDIKVYDPVINGGAGLPPFVDCTSPTAVTIPLGLPPGANTVVTWPDGLFPFCQGACIYQLFPGEEPPHSSNNVDEFCAVVLEAANITPWLQDLFAEVEVGDPDTYPDPEKVEKVIVRIAELLEKGNQTAPPEIVDAWLTATAGFVETGRLATADYDLEALPQDDLRDLVSLIDNPQADDEEAVAAIDAISAWVPVNCFGAVETEPSFTG